MFALLNEQVAYMRRRYEKEILKIFVMNLDELYNMKLLHISLRNAHNLLTSLYRIH